MTGVQCYRLRNVFRRILHLVFLGLALQSVVARTNQNDRYVLVIHSYHEGLTWTDGQNRGIKEVFAGREDIELTIEYLDSKRIPLDVISEKFTRFLTDKYKTRSFDAVIVSDDSALAFVAGCRSALFPETPVVFCGINDYRMEYLNEFGGNLTGVVQTLNPAGTIALIRKLQPDLGSLAVVSCTTPTARAIRDQVKIALEGISGGIRSVWLDGLDTGTLRQRLSELSGHDAVLLCNFNRDADGVYYSHEESARMISRVSGAPVYAMEDQYLGTGVVGGYMNAAVDQGRTAAALCLEVLDTGKIPSVDMTCPNRVMFDYDAMKRFGLDAGRLPASAVVINRPMSFYHQHKNLIVNVVLVFVLLLVAFLSTSYGLVQSRRTEKKLRASEENLRTTLDSIGDAVITTDTKGNIVRMNPVAGQLTGWNADSVVGRPLTEIFKIINSRTREPAENPVDHVLKCGEIMGLANHTELIARDGRRYQIADSAAPIEDDGGKITGVVLVFRDVTEDYKVRKALQESEEQYRLFAENSNDLIWTCKGREENFTITYINPAVESFLGYTVEEYLRLPREKRVAEESIAVMDRAVEDMEKGVSRTIDIKYMHKNGMVIDCELWAKPLFGSDGKISGFQGRSVNITERKRAERRLAEINACLVELGADYSSNVNALTALAGRLMGAGCAVYNRLQGGLLCSLGRWNTPPEFEVERESEGSLCFDLMKGGRQQPVVVRNMHLTEYARRDRNILRCGFRTYVGSPVLCGGGAVGLLYVVYTYDVAPTGDDLRFLGIIASALSAEEDRKRTTEELRRMQRLEELGTVAGGIAHDFNNLLTGIYGNLELALMKLPEAGDAVSLIRKAYGSIENARRLTGQLLTFAKGGAPELTAVKTAELVRESVEFNLHGSKIRAEFHLQEGLWSIQADKGQINQVIANLVVNAKQVMTEGGKLSVEASNCPPRSEDGRENRARDHVRISIRDEGPGISAEIVDRIFDPYFTTKHGGHGLGLSVVQSIVEQHKGWIEVDSKPGIGSTFHVFLPALPECDAEEHIAHPAAEADADTTRPLRILVMDDEEIIRKMGETMIGYMGHAVDTAADGEEAIAKYAEASGNGRPFDLVIMDLTIRGGKGGEETVRDLLKIDPAARVIVASGYASDPVMANYGDYGFSGKLAKPYELAELKREIIRASRG